MQENSIGNKVVEKLVTFEFTINCVCVSRFLNLLRLLVQNYSISEKAFLPNIINFAMKQVYPIVINVSYGNESCIKNFDCCFYQRELPEVKYSLYELLYQLLLNNWRLFNYQLIIIIIFYFKINRYFFPSVTKKTVSGEFVQHEDDFMTIMEVCLCCH